MFFEEGVERGVSSKIDSNIHGGNASAEVAKDRGFAKDKKKKREDEIEFYGAGLQDGNLNSKSIGSSHQDHEKRKDYFGGEAFSEKGISNVGRRFALNSLSEKSHFPKDPRHNLQESYQQLGIAGAGNLFAETTERESNRLFSQDGQITNHAIKMDNYEFFLNNSYYIKSNLAKTLLAKMDLDRDIKGTLSDMLDSDGKWNNGVEPEVVFNELKNRLRNAGREHHKEYEVIIKTFGYIEDVENKHKAFKAKRQKNAIESIKRFEEKLNPMIGSEDDTEKEATSRFLNDFFSDKNRVKLDVREDDTFIGQVRNLIEYYKALDGGAGEVPNYLTDLSNRLDDNTTLASKNAFELEKELAEFQNAKESFVTEHNKSLGTATEILNRFNFRTKHYPVASLAIWADEAYAIDNFAEIEGVDEDMSRAIKDVLGDTGISNAQIESIKDSLREILRENKSDIESIYNPEKDAHNPQRKFQPFEGQNYHEDAHNILRDSLYLALFKEGIFAGVGKDGEKGGVYHRFFSKSDENEIVTSIMDKEIQELRPDVDFTTDLYNAVSAINKTASAIIDDKSFDALIDSPLFRDNQLYDKEDLESIRAYGKDLSRVSEQMKDRDIYGSPETQELKDALQEMIYIEVANDEIAKIKGENRGVGYHFFQNNKALRNLEVCMKGARNPTTSFETVPSLSKGCFEKLKEEFDKQANEINNTLSNPQTAMMGVTFVGALVIFSSIHASAEKDRVDRLIARINSEIAEEASYVQNSVDRLQKTARMMNVESEKMGISNQIVKDGFQEKLIEEAELEHTVRDIVHHSDNGLPNDILLDDDAELKHLLRREVKKYLETPSPLIKRTKESLEKDKRRLEELQEKIRLKQLEHFILEDENIEVNEINRAIEELEYSLGRDSSPMEFEEVQEARASLESKKNRLKEIQDSIILRAKEQPIPETLLNDTALKKEFMDEIEKKEKFLAEEEIRVKERLSTMLERLESRIGRTVVGDKIKFDLEGLEISKELDYEERKRIAEDRNILISLFGSYRDVVNRKILDSEMDTSEEIRMVEYLQKESERIDSIMPSLHRYALGDSCNVGEALAGDIYHNFHFKIPEDILEEARENGITEDVIGKIMEASNNVEDRHKLSDLKRNNLYTRLNEFQKAQSILSNKSRKIDVEAGSNLLSSLLAKFNNAQGSDIGKRIKDSNNFYGMTNLRSDGNAFVSAGKGQIGMFLYELEQAEKKGEYERVNKLMKKLEKLKVNGYISYEQKEEIMARINLSANDMQSANSHLSDKQLSKNRQSTRNSNATKLRRA